MYNGLNVAVVMPVHNEQAQVERAVRRVPQFVDLIVAIDDGSADESLHVLEMITDKRLAIRSHGENRGVGAATKTGYHVAMASGTDLIAVMDGDGQMDGRDLTALLDRAIEGADYVKGNRFLHRETIEVMPRLRYLGNRFFSWLTRRASGFESSLDAHCGYTVIRREALQRLPINELYDRYGFPTELFFAAIRAGLKVENVPVRAVYRDEISGVNPFKVVPTIFYLIGRSYLRRRISEQRQNARLALTNTDPVECQVET